MIFLCDQHGFKSIQGSLFLFVGHEHTTLLAVERAVDTRHSAELKYKCFFFKLKFRYLCIKRLKMN